MKISLCLSLLGAMLVPASVWAQPLATPSTFIANATQILTPDFVREADLILVARLVPREDEPGIAHAIVMDYEVIRGETHVIAAGMVLPTQEVLQEVVVPSQAKFSIVLGQFDPVQQRVILKARLDATPELIEQTKKLAHENQKIAVAFSTDKTRYAPNDDIVLKWEARNTSPQPQKIYVGTYALHYTAIYGGRGYSSASGFHTRQTSDYVTLAPNEVWSDTRTIRGPFPVGQVIFDVTLDSKDNYIGSEAKSRVETDRAKQERVEGVALFEARGKIIVEVQTP